MKRKQGLLFFISSCIPGCGQMHQGYMKRGMSLLTVFCGIFAIAAFLNIGALTALMVPVWLYAFFDSYNLRTQLDGGTAPADAFLLGLDQADGERMALLCRRRHSLVGWGLVFVGVYALYNKFILGQLYWYLEDMGLMNGVLGNVYAVLNRMPELLGCMAVIAVGVWLVKGPQQPEKPDYEEYQPQSDTHEEE